MAGRGKIPLIGVTGVVYQRHNATDTDVRADQEKASLMPRRGFNNSATNKNVSVAINSHRVTKFPTRNIYQYDVWSLQCGEFLMVLADVLVRSLLVMDKRSVASSRRSGLPRQCLKESDVVSSSMVIRYAGELEVLI